MFFGLTPLFRFSPLVSSHLAYPFHGSASDLPPLLSVVVHFVLIYSSVSAAFPENTPPSVCVRSASVCAACRVAMRSGGHVIWTRPSGTTIAECACVLADGSVDARLRPATSAAQLTVCHQILPQCSHLPFFHRWDPSDRWRTRDIFAVMVTSHSWQRPLSLFANSPWVLINTPRLGAEASENKQHL